MDFLDSLKPFIDWLHVHPGWAGIATFVISLGESLAVIGLLIPGSVVMTAIGTLIGAGVLPGWEIILWAVAGAIAGDSISYRLGYHYNHSIRRMWPFTKYSALLERGEKFFTKHGGKSVFFGRFVGPMRPIVPLIAGMMKMKPRYFISSNVASAFIWAPFYMLPGILLGMASLEMDPKSATKLILSVLSILLLVWLTAWLLKRILCKVYQIYQDYLQKLWQFFKTHPRWHVFSSALQDPRHPQGHGQLELALLFILFISCFILFSIGVRYFHFFATFDASAHNFFLSFRSDNLSKIFILITLLGNSWVLIPSIAILNAYLLAKRNLRASIHFLLLMLLCLITVKGLKYFFMIPRPEGLISPIKTFSFPSGHTTSSITFYYFIALFFGTDQSSLFRKIFYSLTTLLCLFIITSRIYLSAHWLSDVIAGTLLGFSLVFLLIISYRRKLSTALSAKYFISLMVISLLTAWFWYASTNYKHIWRRYQLHVTTEEISYQAWWQGKLPNQPLYRYSRTGKPIQLINLQWSNSLTSIQQQLQKTNWMALSTLNFMETLSHFLTQAQQQNLPFLAERNAGKAPSLVMYKSDPNSDFLLVIRLWQSPVAFTGSNPPLWFGTLDYQMPYKHQFWRHKKHHQILITLPPAVYALEKDLNKASWKKLNYEKQEIPNKHISTFQWQGGVLLVRNTD